MQEEHTTGSAEPAAFLRDGETSGEFYERVYDELHGLAARQMRGQGQHHTLQATALVSELFLKLDRQDLKRFGTRAHFISMAARTMRSILVDHARKKNRQKRRPPGERVGLDEAAAALESSSGDLVALDEALQRLGELDPDLVSLVELRFFGSCSVEECARVLDKSARTIQRDWRFAKDWLRQRIAGAWSEPGAEPG